MAEDAPGALMLPKGMRDRDPADKRLQLHVLDIIREVFDLYGYLPLETPLVERMDVLKAKFAAGEEADVAKEIFQVSDQGDRELGLRFDHTVPLCRYVAMNPTTKMPFKRYVMGKVYRDGPIKLGRYREFWQADCDIIGVPGSLAECEGMQVAAEVFRKLDLKVTLYCNSMALLKDIMQAVGISEELRARAIIALDKLKKIGAKGVLAELAEVGVGQQSAQQLLEVTDINGSNTDKIAALRELLPDSEALDGMQQNLELLADLDQVVFDPSLARGLEYYTGFFFESFLNDSQISSSLTGTGRYDKMIGQFSGGKHDFPGVGISFGVSVICDALREKGLEVPLSPTKVYVVPVSEQELPYAMSIAQELRLAGINTDMDLLGRSIGKNFGYADALGIPFVLVLGEDEQAQSTCSLKDMTTGEQSSFSRDELVKRLSA